MGKAEAICLVSCVGQKQVIAAPAKDLYRSNWFIKARAYAEGVSSQWFILSAKYGLVQPDDVILPYEQTLNRMAISDRRNWAHVVQKQMDQRMPNAVLIIVLAGERYREFLMDYLRHRALTVEVPMAGLRIGEQLNWLGSRISDGPAR